MEITFLFKNLTNKDKKTVETIQTNLNDIGFFCKEKKYDKGKTIEVTLSGKINKKSELHITMSNDEIESLLKEEPSLSLPMIH